VEEGRLCFACIVYVICEENETSVGGINKEVEEFDSSMENGS